MALYFHAQKPKLAGFELFTSFKSNWKWTWMTNRFLHTTARVIVSYWIGEFVSENNALISLACGQGNLIATPLTLEPSFPPTPKSLSWIRPRLQSVGRVRVYTPTSINTTPEAARRSWFPQGLAENNKMLNIPPACVMAGAFSAELASLKGKTSLTSLRRTMTIEQAFPSVFSISPWNLWAPCTNKNHLRSLLAQYVSTFSGLPAEGGGSGVLWCPPTHTHTHTYTAHSCAPLTVCCLFFHKWQFASFKQQKSLRQWNHRDKRNWLRGCIHLSDNLKTSRHSLHVHY